MLAKWSGHLVPSPDPSEDSCRALSAALLRAWFLPTSLPRDSAAGAVTFAGPGWSGMPRFGGRCLSSSPERRARPAAG